MNSFLDEALFKGSVMETMVHLFAFIPKSQPPNELSKIATLLNKEKYV